MCAVEVPERDEPFAIATTQKNGEQSLRPLSPRRSRGQKKRGAATLAVPARPTVKSRIG